jgi:hypothetical protein
MATSNPYEMTLGLNVLEHLGINLYSNVPAVLSEAVANCWDADAENVEISFDPAIEEIVISDDGTGMTRDQVNERFLFVGFQRRKKMSPLTAKGRAPMGRKGIGKLSLFSIADEVEVRTTSGGQKSALRMRLADIREKIKSGRGTYYPEPLSDEIVDFTKGTTIILRHLRRRQTISTEEALRRRLARRFSVIGSSHDFAVKVNGTAITSADRDYYTKLQYIWTYDDQAEVLKLCTGLARTPEKRKHKLPSKLSITGWIGTVKKSSDLKDDESGDNLNRIAIYVRGKMAQEDILDDFAERGVYASYLIGELRVDGFDVDAEDDSATSSRQHLVEDDPRYVIVKEHIAKELKHIQGRWSEWRNEDGVKKALEVPAIKDWLDELPKEHKAKAQAWIGRLNRITSDQVDDQKRLLKHAVLAFEFYRANQSIERLEKVDDASIDTVLSLFRDLDAIEISLYGQIVQQRMSVIRALESKVDKNDLEKIIQKYIFDHLWLLDPSWERVDASVKMEKSVKKLFSDINTKLTADEKKGRVDIAYRKTAGKHVVIELKRPKIQTTASKLVAQIEKYRSGIRKILTDLGTPDEQIEFIVVLGKHPKECENPGGKKVVADMLVAVGARYVLYDELLHNADEAYKDYTSKKKSVDRLSGVIKAIDDYSADDE